MYSTSHKWGVIKHEPMVSSCCTMYIRRRLRICNIMCNHAHTHGHTTHTHGHTTHHCTQLMTQSIVILFQCGCYSYPHHSQQDWGQGTYNIGFIHGLCIMYSVCIICAILCSVDITWAVSGARFLCKYPNTYTIPLHVRCVCGGCVGGSVCVCGFILNVSA